MSDATTNPDLFTAPRYVPWADLRGIDITPEDRKAYQRVQRSNQAHIKRHGRPSPKSLIYRCANPDCRARITFEYAKTNEECLKCILARGEEVNPPLWVQGATDRNRARKRKESS